MGAISLFKPQTFTLPVMTHCLSLCMFHTLQNTAVSALYLPFILSPKGGQTVQWPPVQGCCYLCTLKSDKLATCQFLMARLDTLALVVIVQPRRVNNVTVVFVRLVGAPRPRAYWYIFHLLHWALAWKPSPMLLLLVAAVNNCCVISFIVMICLRKNQLWCSSRSWSIWPLEWS